MRTVVIDGVEYEELEDPCTFSSSYGDFVLYLRPLPPKTKTIVQVAAEALAISEERFRETYQTGVIVLADAIEQRLQAIEKKLEGK